MKRIAIRVAASVFMAFSVSASLASAQSSSGQSEAQPDKNALGRILGTTPQKQTQMPTTTGVSGLAEGVARAIVRDGYWFGYWEDRIPKMILENRTLTGWPISARDGKGAYVLVDDLHGEFYCSNGERPLCSTTADYEDALTPAGPDLAEYQTRKEGSGAGQQKITINLQPKLLEDIKFGPFDASKIEKVRRLFDQHILNKEFFENLRLGQASHSAQRAVRIRIGNFNQNSHLIYFYVEGDPYLQTIELNAAGDLFARVDEWRIDGAPHSRDYPHAVKRIEENGSWFVVKDGKLSKE